MSPFVVHQGGHPLKRPAANRSSNDSIEQVRRAQKSVTFRVAFEGVFEAKKKIEHT
jgi:hypothetical protein